MKKLLLVVLAFFLIIPAVSVGGTGTFTVDHDFPGGNVIVEDIENGNVHLALDKRDSPKTCFYWSFRVRNAQNSTLVFDFGKSKVVSKRGPVISLDGGKTWAWQHKAADVASNSFTYQFGPDAKEVRFAVAPPYTQETFQRFFDSCQNIPTLRREKLCVSAKGRDVPLIRFGNSDKSCKIGVVLTARHHARDSTASYVLEGTLAEIFSDSPEGKWLLANADFFVVPFVDLDGVEDGDPGKNRIPHDHNRDYLEKIRPSVKAITAQIPEWSRGKNIVHVDYHCPGLIGKGNEHLFFTKYKVSRQYDQLKRFTDILVIRQKAGQIPYNGIKGSGGDLHPAMSRAWFSSLPNCFLSATAEVPFVSAEGTPITRETLTELGHNIARALADYVQECQPK